MSSFLRAMYRPGREGAKGGMPSFPRAMYSAEVGRVPKMKEQYPKDMEDKRRQLYSVADEARKDTNNKVVLIRDKLFINGKLYTDITQKHTSYQNTTHRQSQNHRDEPRWSKTYYRSRAPNTQAPSTSKPVSTSNPFAVLDSRTPQNTTTRRPTLAGKKKATSPLETGTYFKKPNCYNSDSDTTSEIDLTDSPSLLDTQPPPQERGDQESLTPSDNPGASDQTADQRPEENM
ncbi:hypothetical protein MAR_010228 [Mya arenaria]|uniref:Uncharacterized protein n=1 Tax=Mya arenaria TaxID=6604 RepID=A0ABY7E3Z4_MYAAR|nr:hypothetical protein MAR_010228 [Mya arenaria]